MLTSDAGELYLTDCGLAPFCRPSPPPPSSPLADLADLPRLTTGCGVLAACAATRMRVPSARSDCARGGSEARGNSLQCGGGAGLPNPRPHRPPHLVAGRCGGEQRFQARARGCLGRQQRDFGGPHSMEEASITSNLEEVGRCLFLVAPARCRCGKTLRIKAPVCVVSRSLVDGDGATDHGVLDDGNGRGFS